MNSPEYRNAKNTAYYDFRQAVEEAAKILHERLAAVDNKFFDDLIDKNVPQPKRTEIVRGID